MVQLQNLLQSFWRFDLGQKHFGEVKSSRQKFLSRDRIKFRTIGIGLVAIVDHLVDAERRALVAQVDAHSCNAK